METPQDRDEVLAEIERLYKLLKRTRIGSADYERLARLIRALAERFKERT